ncbi:MAG: SDR family oxidoreductase [Candidatus Cloacimonetes bacterium]|nr:SDR family oxidoreductase [Candidatus Cloacimonadota bacterium]
MNVLITGIMGQVGFNLANFFSEQSHNVIGTYNQQVCLNFPSHKIDLNKLTDTPRNSLKDIDVDFIIHCAAITDVNLAQKKPNLSYKINTDATQAIVSFAKSKNIPIVYLSTDFVFNGFSGNYTENSPTEALSHYALSKLYGESFVKSYQKGIILRFTPIGHVNSLNHQGHSLLDWIIQSALHQQKIQLFRDKTFSPISSYEIFQTILKLIKNQQYGLYHLASQENSIYSAGKLIQEVFQLKPTVEPSIFPQNDYSKIRPKYSHLNSKYLPLFDLKTILKNLKSQRALK